MASASLARVRGNQDGRCSCGEDPRIVRVPSCSLPPGTFPRTARASLRAYPVHSFRFVSMETQSLLARTRCLVASGLPAGGTDMPGTTQVDGCRSEPPRFLPVSATIDHRFPFPMLRTSPSKLACILPRPPWTFPSSLGRHPFRHVTFAPDPTLVSKRSEKKLPSRHRSRGDPPSGEETPSGPSTLPSEACFHPSALQASD